MGRPERLGDILNRIMTEMEERREARARMDAALISSRKQLMLFDNTPRIGPFGRIEPYDGPASKREEP